MTIAASRHSLEMSVLTCSGAARIKGYVWVCLYVCISFKLPFPTVVSPETDISLKSTAFAGWTFPVLTGNELFKARQFQQEYSVAWS